MFVSPRKIAEISSLYDAKGGYVNIMVVVTRAKGDSSDAVWRKFGRLNYEENLLDELRDRKYYKKPSLVRKEKLKNRGKKRRLMKTRTPFRSHDMRARQGRP